MIPKAKLAALLQSRAARIIFGAAIVLFSLAFLAYFTYSNWATLTAHHWQIDYGQLALTLLLNLGAYLAAIGAWHLMIDRLAGVGSLLLNAKIYCYSAVARRLPGVAWDIATRVVMYDYAGASKAVVSVASILELLLIALSGILLYLALMPFTLSYVSHWGSWAPLVAVVLGIVLTHPRVVTYAVRKVKKDALPVSLQYRDTLLWLFLYILDWLLGGLMLYATIRVVHPLPTAYILQLLADWTLAGVLMSLGTFMPTTLALKEVTLTVLMSRYMPEYIAMVGAILTRLLTVAYSILWVVCLARLPAASGKERANG